MSDQGVKVSQLGFDAQDTGDINLLLSSGWPSLKIEATGVFNNLVTSIDTDIYTHNLGYPPFFIIYNCTNNKTFMVGPRQRTSEARFYVTETKLAIEGVGDGSLPPIDIRWYVCRLPINQSFQAPIYNLSSDGSAKRDNDVGIKIPKANADPNSKDLRDFNFHSGTRSPQLHNITTGPLVLSGTNSYELDWINDLGYNPLYFTFQRNDKIFPQDAGRWYGPIQVLQNSHGDLQAFDVTDQSYASIVVFKDPFTPSSVKKISV